MFKKFDIHPKTQEEYRIRTLHGAFVSILALIAAFMLFYSELEYSLKTEVVDHLFIQSSHTQSLSISFNVTFPRVACPLISVDVEDGAGNSQKEIAHDIFKHDLDLSGNYIGSKTKEELGDTLEDEEELKNHVAFSKKFIVHKKSENSDDQDKKPTCGDCYGAGGDGQCCNTCSDVMLAYKKKGWHMPEKGILQCDHEAGAELLSESTDKGGCNIYGTIKVPTGQGNLHFAMSSTAVHYFSFGVVGFNDFLRSVYQSFNITHNVHEFAFGEQIPGLKNPLDGRAKRIDEGHGIYQYYLKLVPTTYRYLNGSEVNSNQFSVTEHMRQVSIGSQRGLPGVYFYYEVSAIQAKFEERCPGHLRLLTSACAIIGGIFTVLGLVDSTISSLFLSKKGAKTYHKN